MGHENRQITRKRANDVVDTAKLENKIKEMFTSLEEAIIIFISVSVCGSVAEWLGSRTCDQQVAGSNPRRCAAECNTLEEFAQMCLCHQAV